MAGLFSLQFDTREISFWANRYQYPGKELLTDEIGPRMKSSSYLSRPDFLALCYWKTPRSKPKVANNSAEFIHEVTRTAFTTPSEQLRIEVLTLLRGVSWPTASVILHFGHRERYPILDVRALWSLGVTYPASAYDFEFWWAYVQACWHLADVCGVDMRTLDPALWQYSKETQPALKDDSSEVSFKDKRSSTVQEAGQPTRNRIEERDYTTDTLDVITLIRDRFRETGNPTIVPLLRHGELIAELVPYGVSVSDLGTQPLLPWAVFQETVALLVRNGGRAARGDAMGAKLGEPGLPFDSIEGHIAHTVYNKQAGETVFRRIAPIAAILIWVGVCEAAPGELVLRTFDK